HTRYVRPRRLAGHHLELHSFPTRRSSDLSELQVAVNVSIRQIKEINFPELVRNTLKETKLAPHALKIEITESMIQNIKESSAVFKQLKDLGVKIVFDYFCTGYS